MQLKFINQKKSLKVTPKDIQVLFWNIYLLRFTFIKGKTKFNTEWSNFFKQLITVHTSCFIGFCMLKENKCRTYWMFRTISFVFCPWRECTTIPFRNFISIGSGTYCGRGPKTDAIATWSHSGIATLGGLASIW